MAKDGQLLLPLLDLVNTAENAIDDLIDVMWRAAVEAILKWMAVVYDVSSMNFKRVMGHKDLWILKANHEAVEDKTVVAESMKAS